VENGETTHYLALGHQVMYEKTGAVGTRHIFAGNQRIAEVPGTAVSYFHNDHLGSTRAITNASGTIIATVATKPFGEPHSPAISTDYLFTGKELDDTGLYYFAARYYDPSVGRFITQDSWKGNLGEPTTQNGYIYVLNNPLGYVDPTGNIPQWAQNMLDHSAGFTYQFLNSMTGGLGSKLGMDRYADGQSEAYQSGRQAGAATALGLSTYTAVMGVAKITGGGVLVLTGFGALPGGSMTLVGTIEGGYALVVAKAAGDYIAKASMQGGGGSTEPQPSNPKKVDSKYLEKHGIDAHKLKRDTLGSKAPISEYNVYADRNGGLWIQRNGSKSWIPTFESIIR